MIGECLAEVLPSMLEWRTILTCGVIMLNPLFWNVLSRLEYLISQVAGGPRRGVTLLCDGNRFFQLSQDLSISQNNGQSCRLCANAEHNF